MEGDEIQVRSWFKSYNYDFFLKSIWDGDNLISLNHGGPYPEIGVSSQFHLNQRNVSILDHESSSSKKPKSFVEAVNNVCDIPTSQLPMPCIKGDRLAIVILEDEYQKGVEACKHNLHGRILWSKGTSPLTVQSLKKKLQRMWNSIGKWGLTSLGKGYYEFSFSCLEDVHQVRAVHSWNLHPGILKLFTWSRDFNPSLLKQTSAQVRVRIHGLA